MAKVFISYSNHDVVLARILSNVFKEQGVECFFAEQDLKMGSIFDSEIQKEIQNASYLVLLLSRNSVRSAWVNQEIGIAIANNIRILPIAIEGIEEIEKEGRVGFLHRTHGATLSQSHDPYSEIVRLAKDIKNTSPESWSKFRPNIDEICTGRENRTRRIVEICYSEIEKTKRPSTYTLRLQAAFSSFAVSDDPSYRVAGYHTSEYHQLLTFERDGLKRFLERSNLKAILWPKRPYDDRFMRIRFDTLIKFLEDFKPSKHQAFVLGEYKDGNQIIFNGNTLVKALKMEGEAHPGYNFTLVTYQKPNIDHAIKIFDNRFEDILNDHAKNCGSNDPGEIHTYVIEELKQQRG